MEKFAPFNLIRLLRTIFNPKEGERVCVLIDLENPSDVVDFKFLKDQKLPIQKKAYEVFYQGISKEAIKEFHLECCNFFAYKATGGSNLELPDTVIAPDGKKYSLIKDIYPEYDIILCISTYSATAPLTAAAKKFNFRGGTLHGLNDIVLNSGLSVDYNNVSRETEMLRKGMTQAESADIDFEVNGKSYSLHIDLGKQEAQKSHGICHEPHDIVNLPAGEVYFVPVSASGQFPIKFEEDGTLGLMDVSDGKIKKVTLIKGDQKIVNKYQNKFVTDPATGVLGELGFGTQVLPFSGADIQDEKIFGTFHIATGRNDHLSGSVTKESFVDLGNATHDDILFSSTKTPEIQVKQVRLNRKGKTEILIENYEPCPYLLNLLRVPTAKV